MSVTVAELIAAASVREAPLAAESAGYVVLATADQVCAAPRRITPPLVQLHEDGAIRLCGGEPCGEADAENALRGLLEQLLLVSSSLTPSLLRVARRPAPSGLPAFVAELEAALIPVNRSAARRALARLGRETVRALERGLEVTATDPASQSPLPVLRPASVVPVAAPLPVPPVVPAIEPLATPSVVDEQLLAASSPLPPVDVEWPAVDVETRPEPLSKRPSSIAPAAAVELAPSAAPAAAPQPSSHTPRLGTLLSAQLPNPAYQPLVELEELTDPMTLPGFGAEPADVEEEFFDVHFESETAQPPEAEPELESTQALELEQATEAEPEIAMTQALEPEPEPEPEPELETTQALELRAEPEPVQVSEPELPVAALPVFDDALPELAIEVTAESPAAPPVFDDALPEPAIDTVVENRREPRVTLPRAPRRSELGQLLEKFGREQGPTEPELCSELKKLAGLDLTPPPPTAR